MKRLYKLVSTKQTEDGYQVLLDGRPVMTPAKNTLQASTEALANALVKEWAEQGDEIIPERMKLTQILSTKIDRVSVEREVMTVTVLAYLDTDLLCYPAASPPELAKKQEEIWAPWRNWFAEKFGVALETTTGLSAIKQPKKAHEAVADYVAGLSDDRFTVLQLITAASGSLVIALAFTEQAITPEEVFRVARVEEMYKAELCNEAEHGADPTQAKKDAAMQDDLEAARIFLSLF